MNKPNLPKPTKTKTVTRNQPSQALNNDALIYASLREADNKTRRRSYLVAAWLFSFLFHGLFLSLLSLKPLPSTTAATTLEVILVNTFSETPPNKAQALAQHSLSGGGDDDSAQLASAPQTPALLPSPSERFLLLQRQRQKELEQQQQELLSQLRAHEQFVQLTAATVADLGHSTATDDIELLISANNAKIRALKQQIQEYNQRPKTYFVGPSTQEAVFADYVEQWRHQIEEVGTNHYPTHNGSPLYGELQITVYIQSDGQLQEIELNRPSTQAALNLAAQRIIQLAAPFPAFSEALKNETDVLAITRTWHFTNEHLLTSTHEHASP